MKKESNILLFKIIAVAIIAFIFISLGVFKGEFLDGLTYASISRNLAIHQGSIFTLFYNDFLYSKFYEHPPFFFIVESIFFKLLGDHFLVEKLFGFLVFLISTYMIKKILSVKFNQSFSFVFIALFSLIFMGYVWVFKNNMLECLLIPLILSSYYFSIKKNGSIYLNASFASLFFVLAVFTKGPFSLFIGFAFFVEHLPFNKAHFRMNCKFYSIYFLVILTTIICCFLYPDTKEFFTNYIDVQVLKSLQGKREITSRFIYIENCFYLLIPVILVISFYLLKHKSIQLSKFKTEWILILIYSLTILISPKQHAYYVVLIAPFLIIIFTDLFMPLFLNFVELVKLKTSRLISIIVFLIALNGVSLISNYEKPKHSIRKYIELSNHLSLNKEEHFTFSPETSNNWYLIAVLSRYNNHQISVHANYHLALKKINRLNNLDIELINDYYLEYKQLNFK